MIHLNQEPYFDNGLTKWYKDEELTDFATREQDNMSSLGNAMCFAVIGENVSDYVLIDGNQNVLVNSHYGVSHSFDTMKTKIVALKVTKNFDKNEKVQNV